jgi:aminopeptidase-like protein
MASPSPARFKAAKGRCLNHALGESLHAFIRELYPLCRSISGEGLRQTLRLIQNRIPITVHEVPTGTPVLDWDIPNEWNIRGARIETADGRTIMDFRDHSLHVVNYSGPIDAVVTRAELARHVHTLPDQPDLIPYRTGYFSNDWGFCLSHKQWQSMRDDHYRVVIDSTLAPGSVSYGELFIPGVESGEVLISVHCCHPSLANDNLTGIAIATELARFVSQQKRRRLGYRFLFIPGTIGSIAWLARNEAAVKRIRHGLILTCLGDAGAFHYKQSRQGIAIVDRAAAHVLRHSGQPFEVLPFSPYGYDERQFCSPAYDLPVGCFMRSPNGSFPEYHTSADNLDFVSPAALDDSFQRLCDILGLLDTNAVYRRVDGRGEPQLGRRGLYRAISGQKEAGGVTQMALLWVLNLADGHHSLLDMAERADMPYADIRAAAELALTADLIEDVEPQPAANAALAVA